MTPADRLARAGGLLDEALAELELAEPDIPGYSLQALVFLRAEIRVSRRRIANVAKVLGTTTHRPPPAA